MIMSKKIRYKILYPDEICPKCRRIDSIQSLSDNEEEDGIHINKIYYCTKCGYKWAEVWTFLYNKEINSGF